MSDLKSSALTPLLAAMIGSWDDAPIVLKALEQGRLSQRDQNILITALRDEITTVGHRLETRKQTALRNIISRAKSQEQAEKSTISPPDIDMI